MIEFFGKLFGFWMFVFSGTHRDIWLFEFQRANLFFKCIHILESIVSIVVGVGVPVLFAYMLITW